VSRASIRRFSLAGKLAALLFLVAALGAIAGALLLRATGEVATAVILALALLALPLLWLARRSLRDVLSLFRALAGTVESYRDGDFSFGITSGRRDELGDLVRAHNALGDTLREQRVSLVQRELLLDTMVQNTPVAMLLVAPGGHVVYGNLAARRLLGEGRRLEGQGLEALLQAGPEALREAMARGGDGLFAVGTEDEEETFHLARRRFRLNGREHELILLRHLTHELRRQEVQVWKKVLRVISHELNNSLAPVASLAHSGAELVRRGRTDRLESVFATIEERARHLESFIRGYARFAKLPSPRPESVPWRGFLERLRSQIDFALEGGTPESQGWFDPAQLEQALLNLLKNAHEAGGAASAVVLRLRQGSGVVRIEVLDRGSGMSEAVLANALVPFYSTKHSGTGLGLALAREIAEAHGGRIALANREGGGLCVALTLPDRA
jgi:two-component system, NtrC family, nitrogen regulation sensor histidine kinase NtrY